MVEAELRELKAAIGDLMRVAGGVSGDHVPWSIHLRDPGIQSPERFRQETQLLQTPVDEFLTVAVTGNHVVQRIAQAVFGTGAQDNWIKADRFRIHQRGADARVVLDVLLGDGEETRIRGKSHVHHLVVRFGGNHTFPRIFNHGPERLPEGRFELCLGEALVDLSLLAIAQPYAGDIVIDRMDRIGAGEGGPGHRRGDLKLPRGMALLGGLQGVDKRVAADSARRLFEFESLIH